MIYAVITMAIMIQLRISLAMVRARLVVLGTAFKYITSILT